MKYVVFDTETTGLKAGIEDVVQLAYIILDADCRTIIGAGNRYFKPDKEVSSGAFKVHGLTANFLNERSKGKNIKDFMQEDNIFTASDEDVCFVGYNVSFDISMVRGAVKRRYLKKVHSGELKASEMESLLPDFGRIISNPNPCDGKSNFCLMNYLTRENKWGRNKKLVVVNKMYLEDLSDSATEAIMNTIAKQYNLSLREGAGYHDAFFDTLKTALLLCRLKGTF